MKRKILTFLCALALVLCLVGCGEEAGETATLTGIVMSVDGTVITLMEVDSGDRDMSQRPTMPEGEIPSMPEGEMPSMPEGAFKDFDGTVPEGGFEGFDGTVPEGETPPKPEDGFEGFDGTLPEGATMPSGGRGSRDFSGEGTQVDLANAHITVEFDGGKATGSMEDVTAGAYVTVTLNSRGEATNLLVSESTGFGGRGEFDGGQGGNRGEFGDRGGFQQMPTEPTN